ncbi:MAG: sigma-70 family RNA polymerase sigma factor [Blastocatellia bacterium]
MMNGVHISLTDWQSDATAERDAAKRLSFEQAFAAHHRLVYRYAVSLTRDAGLAEDVVQEVFVRLYQNLEAAQRDEMLRAWLLRVTANVARNVMRGRSRAQSRDESFVARQENVTTSPESELMRQAEIEEARRALAKLKEPLRSCLLLRNEGLSYREIAAALELNEASVGGLLARARREFIRVFGKVGKS